MVRIGRRSTNTLFIVMVVLAWMAFVVLIANADDDPLPKALSPEALVTLSETPSAPLEQHAADPDKAPCNCQELIVSDSLQGGANGLYTYEPGFQSEFFGDSQKWMGPKWQDIGGIDLYWAIVRINDGPWVGNVVVGFYNNEHVIYVVEDYVMANSTSPCPPLSGWTLGPFTITPLYCLCGTIGDVNGDNYTDVSDVRGIYVHAIEYLALPDHLVDRGDIDQDGDVDLDDAELLARILTEITPCVP